ncbi:hypothetical protein GXP71_03525 [Cellulomonas sp. H30R-01]|uniref:hypothetical protein n=1 Tax=Cellulomonas sp. H30R-01 TaxID=2704467 RepID=UPI00138D51B3|nr:hypothetical protein [Cellulomonas sp. H30R-01]QHT55246.1 hypothetical protein GXP71_03525 [Cellulomonas sp. H30R-01]
MHRIPTALIAALTLVVGFAVAQATDVRALGGAVLLAGGAWCAVRSWRRAGPVRTVAVLVVAALCFVVSHLLAPHLGAWPSVLLVAVVLAAVTWTLVDRPMARVRARS